MPNKSCPIPRFTGKKLFFEEKEVLQHNMAEFCQRENVQDGSFPFQMMLDPDKQARPDSPHIIYDALHDYEMVRKTFDTHVARFLQVCWR